MIGTTKAQRDEVTQSILYYPSYYFMFLYAPVAQTIILSSHLVYDNGLPFSRIQ